jgi:hypothetical protein
VNDALLVASADEGLSVRSLHTVRLLDVIRLVIEACQNVGRRRRRRPPARAARRLNA